jgi:hypothetical protein
MCNNVLDRVYNRNGRNDYCRDRNGVVGDYFSQKVTRKKKE